MVRTTRWVFLLALLVISQGCSSGESGGAGGGAPAVDYRTIEGSPFGFHPGGADDYFYLQELGASWSREATYVIWDWVDVDRDGGFLFRNATTPPHPDHPGSGGPLDYDAYWSRPPAWVNLVANLCPFRRGGEFADEAERDVYREFVRKLVERYDGDDNTGCSQAFPDCYEVGDQDAPTAETAAALAARPIKHWQVCNQVTDACNGPDCPDTSAAKFAAVQLASYDAVKEADAEAFVLIAGDSARDLYPPVFEAMGGQPGMDIVDFHRFGTADTFDPEEDLVYLRSSLEDGGYDLDSLQFWFTETGTYTGDPVDDINQQEGPPFQFERDQAVDITKRHVTAMALGVQKLFWAWGIMEGFGCSCCLFDYTGLVYDGNEPPEANGCDQADPYDLGAGVKKLGYFAYRLMVETLDGATGVATIEHNDAYRIYQYIKAGKRIWVVWASGGETIEIVLDTRGATTVRVTKGVPDTSAGQDVSSYSTAFDRWQEPVDDELPLMVGAVPWFVEEL